MPHLKNFLIISRKAGRYLQSDRQDGPLTQAGLLPLLWKGQLLPLAWPPATPAEVCKTEFLVVSPSLCSQVAFVVSRACEFNGPHATNHQLGSPALTVTGLFTGCVIQGIHGRVTESGLPRFIIKY